MHAAEAPYIGRLAHLAVVFGRSREANFYENAVRAKFAESGRPWKARTGRPSSSPAIEKRHRDIVRDLQEHAVPQDHELTHEDVNLWCRSAYFVMAHTAPQNPHAYYSRK